MSEASLIRRSAAIVFAFRHKTITKVESEKALNALYELAWKEDPNAEPDGYIEYSIATAHQELEDLSKAIAP